MRQGAPLPLAIAVSVALLAGGVALAGPAQPFVAVAWPVSTGLLVGEVATGGVSASDEFAEIYNAAPTAIDLGGLELAYVTSTGGTVTRKATWSGGTLLQPGGHLLVANSAGAFASVADALYSGGFTATGGALVLRPIGGAPIDAVGWGDATNAFVESSTAAAPPAGQSIERRPGGLAGNATDTNDNSRDFFIDATPVAQNLAAPPVPAPLPTATPAVTPTAAPTPGPTTSPTEMATATATALPTPDATGTPVDATPTASSTATPSADASAFPSPTSEPAPTDGPSPTAAPTGSAVPASPTPSPAPTATSFLDPSPTPTATPVPTATPGVVSVAQARAAADGQAVAVIATLTTPAGLIEGGTGAFVQDETAGISVYLATADWPVLAAGTLVQVHGTVDDRYAQRTIRMTTASDIVPLGSGALPLPVGSATGTAGEALEGSLVSVVARVVAGADPLADGFAVTVDDGSGGLRVVAGELSGIVASDLPAQEWLRLTGALGQRDSSGTGVQGYRLYLRSLADIEGAPQPTPSPAPQPTPTSTLTPTIGPSSQPTATANPTPSATSSPSPTPNPTATANPSPTSPITIAAARALPLDSMVTVEGVATVEAGRIIDTASTVVQDATAGITVRLPAAGWPSFARGDLLRIRGAIGQRYGNLEMRPSSAAAITVLGHGVSPVARPVSASELGEAVEGQLVRCQGVVVSLDALGTTGNFGLDLKDVTGTLRVFVYGTTGIARGTFVTGATVEVSGIEGQHAPSLGSTLGHRVWPRDPADVRAIAVTPSPGATPPPTPSPGPGVHGRVPIATAIQAGGSVTIEGTVTTPPGFVDAAGRRLVVEDESGALMIRLPSDGIAPAVGTRIAASGAMGSYYGSPQLALDAAPEQVGRGVLAPHPLSGVPDAEMAWRLVRVSGQVASVHRLGTTWRAELTVGRSAVPVSGVARSGIRSTALVEGRFATVTGIVRPPYPTATDRRSTVAPRFVADVSLGGGASGAGLGGASGTGSGASGASGGPSGPADGAPVDVELGELADHEGTLVRVGGLVASVGAMRIEIDDGTAASAILLPADASGIVADLRQGDALNATGTVVRDEESWAVAPRSAADIARVGRLGELAPFAPVTTPSPGPSSAVNLPNERLGAHGDWPVGTLPTLVALAGTAVTMALRRRDALEIGRRVGGLLGRIGR